MRPFNSLVALALLYALTSLSQVTFTDVTATAGTGLGETTTRGIAWADFNNDGFPDLFIPTAGNVPNKLYKNSGNGTFTEGAAAVGLNDLANTITCSWGDFNNDGDLDLLTTATGAITKLWRNNLRPGNDTTFTDITPTSGISMTAGQMPAWADYNRDGYVDFYSPISVSRHTAANQTITITEQQSPPAPHIIAYPDTLTLVQANRYTDSLWIGNSGTAPLIVDSIYTSPNDTLRFTLMINPRNFTVASGDSQLVILYEVIGLNQIVAYGFAESLYVSSNDPSNSLIHVFLRGDYAPTLEVRESTNPAEFRLEQNHPNPFNPATVIRYSLTTEALATLKVFDVLGREIATLVNETQFPGTYEAQWSGETVAGSSSVYFYRLSSGSHTQTRKMLFLK